jgi:hypothetical protein
MGVRRVTFAHMRERHRRVAQRIVPTSIVPAANMI